MNLEIQERKIQNQYLLELTGEVDAYTAPILKEKLLPLTEQQGMNIELDLGGTSYMDSTGLGVFIAGYKSADQFGSTLTIKNMTPRVKRLFEITGVSALIDDSAARREGLK